jgi:2-amino-4-hydroxy-6-hydroxymethyldihydropteridine diphosphokinase
MAIVYIGLGSNMGNRAEYLRSAAEQIVARCGAFLMAESSVKETKAVDFEAQPDFLNQIIKIKTEIEPVTLLNLLKEIEVEMGRIYRFSKGPREIDIDILLYNDLIMDESILKIPHPEILRREFILEHLAELDPELTDPVSKKKYSEVLYHAGI